MKKLIPLLLLLAILAGIGMANLGERRVYPLRPGLKYRFTSSRDPNNWWDDVNDVYTIHGLLEVDDINTPKMKVKDVNVTGDLTLSGLTKDRLLYLDNDSNVASVADLSVWIIETTDQIIVTPADGKVTLSLPQDYDTGATPTLAGLTITGNSVFGLNSSVFQPTSDSTTFFQIKNAAGTQIVSVDTTNGKVDFGGTTNYTQFAANGLQTMVGTARAWKDVELKPLSVRLPGANAPATDEIDNFGFHRFDRGTEESVFYVWVVPEDFATGNGSVKGHFTFVVENPPSGTGDENVRMGFEYKKISDGDVFSFSSGTSTGTVDETITDGETAFILHITPDGTCTTTGWVPHDHILFRFYRDATAGSDTYDNEGVAANNDVWVKTYHLQYLINKLGEAA